MNTASAPAQASQIICPACESTNCTEKPLVDFFPYGLKGKPQVVLAATVPMMSCGECELKWTDERGEDARAAAIVEHIRKRKDATRGR